MPHPFDPKNLELPPELMTGVEKKPAEAAGKQPRRPRQPAERYVQITETGAEGFAVLEGRMALVWFEILYRVWNNRSMTIKLPNGTLAEMGVSRWVKYRALRRLELAGWIGVERPNRKTVKVTLLNPGCVKPWM